MKTVRLTDLTANQRAVVLALIAAAKAVKPEPLPSPEKPSGAAHSKEDSSER